jgi:hypothetical protein
MASSLCPLSPPRRSRKCQGGPKTCSEDGRRPLPPVANQRHHPLDPLFGLWGLTQSCHSVQQIQSVGLSNS